MFGSCYASGAVFDKVGSGQWAHQNRSYGSVMLHAIEPPAVELCSFADGVS